MRCIIAEKNVTNEQVNVRLSAIVDSKNHPQNLYLEGPSKYLTPQIIFCCSTPYKIFPYMWVPPCLSFYSSLPQPPPAVGPPSSAAFPPRTSMLSVRRLPLLPRMCMPPTAADTQPALISSPRHQDPATSYGDGVSKNATHLAAVTLLRIGYRPKPSIPRISSTTTGTAVGTPRKPGDGGCITIPVPSMSMRKAPPPTTDVAVARRLPRRERRSPVVMEF